MFRCISRLSVLACLAAILGWASPAAAQVSVRVGGFGPGLYYNGWNWPGYNFSYGFAAPYPYRVPYGPYGMRFSVNSGYDVRGYAAPAPRTSARPAGPVVAQPLPAEYLGVWGEDLPEYDITYYYEFLADGHYLLTKATRSSGTAEAPQVKRYRWDGRRLVMDSGRAFSIRPMGNDALLVVQVDDGENSHVWTRVNAAASAESDAPPAASPTAPPAAPPEAELLPTPGRAQ